MRLGDFLASNLRALMASRPDLDTLPKITARCGVSNGTLDRIRRAAVSTRVDQLERLAQAFGVEAWELLRPNGHARLSPLAWRLAEHLDRKAHDEATHTAAYAAATAVIDALATRPATLPMAEPTADVPAEPARIMDKPTARCASVRRACA
jgi:transcriptional regulator with XRE-family HTH domain